MGRPELAFVLRMPMPSGRLVGIKFEFELASSTKSKDGERWFHVVHWGPSHCEAADVVTTVLSEDLCTDPAISEPFRVVSGEDVPTDCIRALTDVLEWARS